MPSFQKTSRVRRGAAAVEFALIAPLLILLLLGVWEIGRLMEVKQLLVNAAREGGRAAAAGAPEDEVVNVVRAYMKNAGLPAATSSNAAVKYKANHLLTDGDKAYLVEVTIPYGEVSWLPASMWVNSPQTVSALVVWLRE